MVNRVDDEENADDAAVDAGTTDAAPAEPTALVPPPPDAIADLAGACVRFVERSVGVRLDYTPETLPLLDHYLAEARTAFSGKSDASKVLEPRALVAEAAAAYFGEVVRRRHACWWRLDVPDAGRLPVHRLEFSRLHLVIHPVMLVEEALDLDAESELSRSDLRGFELSEADVKIVEQRLAELPAVDITEFVSLATRLEVLDILSDTIVATRGAEAALEARDYVH